MPEKVPPKVIIDTNLWISFLIGKRLADLQELIIHWSLDKTLYLEEAIPSNNTTYSVFLLFV